MNSSQAYKTLEIDRNTDFEEVKYAYRKLALQYHPDKNKDSESEKRFKVITEAYHFLKNQNKHSARQKPEKHQEESDYTQTSQKFYKRTKWGKDGEGKTPEADWGKYTKDFEANEEWWKRYENEFWEKYEKTVNEQTKKEPDRGFTKKRKEFELKVDVDQSLCIGCCSCEIIAPGVFTIDKNTKSNPKSRVYNKKGAKNQKIINAAETCPTKAIIVDNLDENERIYPY